MLRGSETNNGFGVSEDPENMVPIETTALVGSDSFVCRLRLNAVQVWGLKPSRILTIHCRNLLSALRKYSPNVKTDLISEPCSGVTDCINYIIRQVQH